jgi:hypothetical protein
MSNPTSIFQFQFRHVADMGAGLAAEFEFRGRDQPVRYLRPDLEAAIATFERDGHPERAAELRVGLVAMNEAENAEPGRQMSARP